MSHMVTGWHPRSHGVTHGTAGSPSVTHSTHGHTVSPVAQLGHPGVPWCHTQPAALQPRELQVLPKIQIPKCKLQNLIPNSKIQIPKSKLQNPDLQNPNFKTHIPKSRPQSKDSTLYSNTLKFQVSLHKICFFPGCFSDINSPHPVYCYHQNLTLNMTWRKLSLAR